MVRPICRAVVVLVVLVSLAGGLRAADKAPPKKDPPKRDPVERAFALPPGLVLTPQEKEWANKVREELEPKLRDALKRVEQATTDEEKITAGKEVREVKEEIQKAIDTILEERAKKAAEEYAKKQAEARKKAAAHKNKKSGGKKKGGKRR